jgi:hypothetical protein
VSATSMISIRGVKVALEGDQIICPACKGMGKIQCVSPRLTETCNGKAVALEDDLCICSCPSPPKLKATQSSDYQNIGAKPNGPSESGTCVKGCDARGGSGLSSASPAAVSYDDRYVLVDDDTGFPLGQTEYAIRRASGAFEFGTTDEDGHTHLLSATLSAESVQIYF